MKSFPYPDKLTARDELTRDILYRKIPQADRIAICDRAWEMGVSAANDILEEFGKQTDIWTIMDKCGLAIERVNKDRIVGNLRYFSEYFPKESKIYIYTQSVKIFGEKNGIGYDAAEELILSHEFFHYLECTRLGEASMLYVIPTMSIGKRNVNTSGIKALSEIGAHGFARTFYEAVKDVRVYSDSQSVRFINSTVNPVEMGKTMRSKLLGKNGLIASALKRK